MIPGLGSVALTLGKELMLRQSVAFDYRLGRHKGEMKMQKVAAMLTGVRAKMDDCLSFLALAFASYKGLAAASMLIQLQFLHHLLCPSSAVPDPMSRVQRHTEREIC